MTLPIANQYDLVFSIGGACSCTQVLRKAGLQYQSFPFDWLRGASILARAEMIANDMRDFLVQADLQYVGKNQNGLKDIYRSVKTGIVYNHDFPVCVALKDSFPVVEEKYRRRYARLLTRMEAARRALVVYLTSPEDPCPSDGEVTAAQGVLAKRFPAAEIDILVLENAPGAPRAWQLAPHVAKAVLSYRDETPNAQVWSVRFNRLCGLLAGVSVPDYRTEEERRNHGRKVLMSDDNREKALYDYLHCTSALDYFWMKLNWRLYRHFRKVLVKRGVEPW